MKYIYTLLIFQISISISSQHSVQKEIERITMQPFFKHAQLGIAVRNIKDGTLYVNVAKDKMFIPASTLKLVTTLIAKKKLGDNFRFRTKLSYNGEIEADGTLKGNIFIEGSGDPTLGSGRMEGNMNMNALLKQMALDVKKAGILTIEGDIIVETTYDNTPPLVDSWQWNDIGNYYATGSWSLNINENLYNIFYHRNVQVGAPAVISYIEPYIPMLSINSSVTVDKPKTDDNAYIFGAPMNYQKVIRGTIPQGKGLYKIKGAIPDPPLFMAYKLHTTLFQDGIKSNNYKTAQPSSTKTRKLLATYFSPKLIEIIRLTNDFSINLYAEALLTSLSENENQKSKITTIKRFFSESGLDTTALQIEDGSGLSTRNLISPDLMTLFLSKQLPNLSENDIKHFISSPGESGTAKKLLINSPAKKNIWLKSGSMAGIQCYAGYCRTASGNLVSFAVFLNGSTATKDLENKLELEKILDAIYRFS